MEELPADLQKIPDTSTFKKRLKTDILVWLLFVVLLMSINVLCVSKDAHEGCFQQQYFSGCFHEFHNFVILV